MKILTRVKHFWKEFWRKEPCTFCGLQTRDKNIHGEFFHTACFLRNLKQTRGKRLQEEADRRQIDIYKQAIRELEAEKLNQEAK